MEKRTKTKKSKTKKQKGGDGDLLDYNSGGTGGSPITYIQDIFGVIVYSINALTNTALLVEDVAELPYDMSVAFESPSAPNPNNIVIDNNNSVSVNW